MNKIISRCAVAAAATLCAGVAAASGYPASIVATWTIRANDTQPFTFTVSSQSADTPCAQIGGLIGPSNDTIGGYYCPTTGAVSFLRNSAQTGATFQVFTGSLSLAGKNTYMTGSFTNYAGGNDTGAYAFTAEATGLSP